MPNARMTFALLVIAAVLAFAAALIGYARTGDVRLPLVAAGLFLLVAAVGTRRRR